MPSRRVVVSLVVVFSVVLPQSTHTQEFTKQPPVNLSDYSFTNIINETTNFTTEANVSDSPKTTGESTDGPVVTTVQTPITESIKASDGCTCNVTPDFCDIGCCCDNVDCGVTDLSSVFNKCPEQTKSAVCIESWLMFQANVDPQLVTNTGSLFCVQKENDLSIKAQTAPAATEASASIFSPHFSLAEISSTRNANVYKVDDVILTYYNATSIVSMLRQPTPGAGSSSCVQRNPARFLRSGSSSCSRIVSAQSCLRDSGLSSSSYFTGFSLLRIPITLPVNPPEPAERNGSCLNVVSKVEYVITYTSAGEITAAVLKLNVTNARLGMQILQQHAVQFQLATPSTPPPKLPLVGLEVGMPVIGWFGGRVGPGELCKTGCLVPVSLSVRFLWAQRGLLALPQNHILGVKYVFSCQILKCPIVSPLPLTTEVIFSETTVYPEPPRAKPQPEWKFPFGFFTRGTEELDRV
ncbi:Tectonic-3 [Bagarius yarrelli]|uniref:Tectonic-3 n=1 Tax=Bagarius yarrelli TaxID=175774 RepID=A0A556U0X9_BAGYA|nr:Tectonic-3 [Bagarius yarrelli]